MSPGETGCRAVYSRYLIRIPDADRIIDALRRQGILAQRPVERSLHDLLGLRSRFPITEAACAGIVSLPIYPSLRDREVERIVEATARLLS
jgi:dTDP-4-amino-4,6-dideoxygalactose transaminase